MNKILKGLPGYFSLIGQPLEADRPAYLMMNLETTCSYCCLKCCLPGRERPIGRLLLFEERKRALKLAEAAGIRILVIIGAGEPTEEPGYSELVRPVIAYADRLGMGTILFTTASHLTKEQTGFFLSHNVSIYISLDSLQPETYRFLTGCGDLNQVMGRLRMLRSMYAGTITEIGGTRIIRLGINTAVCLPNISELERLKAFAGDDMHYVANSPMRRGRFAKGKVWQTLVGDRYDALAQRAQEMSETGGPTSTAEGVCSYSSQGFSVDVDGELLVCCYAGETAGCFGNIRQIVTPEDLLRQFRSKQERCQQFFNTHGHDNPCPLRDKNWPNLVAALKNSPSA